MCKGGGKGRLQRTYLTLGEMIESWAKTKGKKKKKNERVD